MLIRQHRLLVLTIMIHLIVAAIATFLYASLMMAEAEIPDQPGEKPLISFSIVEEFSKWRTVNDNVMGGRSLGGGNISDGMLVFSGSLNTRGGGFSSVRRKMTPGEIKGDGSFIVSLRADGRTYKLIARTDVRFMRRYVSYQATIPVGASGEWISVRIPFDDFTPTVFGREIPANRFDPSKVDELGFIIADEIDGPFSLQVRSIGVSG